MNNILVSVESNNEAEFNFVFTKSGPTNTHSHNKMTAVPIPQDVRYVKMFYMSGIPTLYGL